MAVSTKARGKGINANKMTPEIYFARKLASNEKKIRDKSLKKLKRWITARSAVPDAFSEDELMKLWKGLFYCMWMSDKPLIQEDLAETISGLVHCVVDRKLALKFITVALRTMARDWSGIDTWRMDKFLMFVRRIVRHSLEYLAQGDWSEEEVVIYSKMMSDVIINANENTATLKVPIGLQLHIANLFPEELAKAGGEDLASSVILKMMEPFVKCLATSNDYRLKKEVYQHVFTYLIKQSDEALEYEERGLEKEAIVSMSDAKTNRKKARKNRKKEEVVQEEEEEQDDDGKSEDEEVDVGDGDDELEMEESNFDWGAKDPRAGGVDVVLPQITPDYNQLADMLFQVASDKSVRAKNRKAIYDLVKKFRDLASGIYPLAVQFPTVGPGLTPRFMKSAAKKFIMDELSMTEQRLEEKKELKKFIKKNNVHRTAEDIDAAEDVDEALMKDLNEGGVVFERQEEIYEDGDFADLEDEVDDEEDMEDEEEDTEDDEEEDIEDQSTVDMEEEEKDMGEFESSDDDELTDEEEVFVAPSKKPKKGAAKSKGSLPTFEVENNWEEEPARHAASMQQLKQKLKAGKRPINPGWSESPTKGEIEIVIPNKKFKGSAKLQPPQLPMTPENPRTKSTPRSADRRVNFVLNKNTAQEPKDYQESIRKSPGVPHDPDRQPSGGGVLKRNNDSSKLASPSTRKPQRGGRNSRAMSRI